MPINNVTGYPSTQTQRNNDAVQVSRSDTKASQDKTGRPSSVDTVSLTDTAAKLQSLENTIAGLPIVDSPRVEAIKLAIEDGSYETDTQRVADKMVQFEFEMFGE
jgi:negative regulator of flagellin synthesis FlgM